MEGYDQIDNDATYLAFRDLTAGASLYHLDTAQDDESDLNISNGYFEFDALANRSFVLAVKIVLTTGAEWEIRFLSESGTNSVDPVNKVINYYSKDNFDTYKGNWKAFDCNIYMLLNDMGVVGSFSRAKSVSIKVLGAPQAGSKEDILIKNMSFSKDNLHTDIKSVSTSVSEWHIKNDANRVEPTQLDAVMFWIIISPPIYKDVKNGQIVVRQRVSLRDTILIGVWRDLAKHLSVYSPSKYSLADIYFKIISVNRWSTAPVVQVPSNSIDFF
jgi:hypothetical protein